MREIVKVPTNYTIKEFSDLIEGNRLVVAENDKGTKILVGYIDRVNQNKIISNRPDALNLCYLDLL